MKTLKQVAWHEIISVLFLPVPLMMALYYSSGDLYAYVFSGVAAYIGGRCSVIWVRRSISKVSKILPVAFSFWYLGFFALLILGSLLGWLEFNK
ncbi:hypothetical protein [Vibrio stylophorae]|nr:hypothetical protein [Vibrio stylophorae]